MKRQYHILNGDALKEQFPTSIQGDIMVARECLAFGSVHGDSLDAFYKTRAAYISSNYENCSQEDYFEMTVSEFQKMQAIVEGSDINLWFEDDLFCQVNFWFTIHLLSQSKNNNLIYLVRPETHDQYGFGGLDKAKLVSIYENRLLLSNIDKLAELWKAYQDDSLEEMSEIAKVLSVKYPFIPAAVNAHIERIGKNGKLGRPSQTILEIIQELDTRDFSTVFKEFCKRESIYGYGDSQVKHLFENIINNHLQ